MVSRSEVNSAGFRIYRAYPFLTLIIRKANSKAHVIFFSVQIEV